VADPKATIRLQRSWWTVYQNAATGCLIDVLNIRIASNAPNLVRGNFTHLHHSAPIGFNTLYLQGYLDHFLESLEHGLSDRIDVRVDVTPESSSSQYSHPRYLGLQEALDLHLVTPDSPLVSYSRKYGINTVSLYGPGLIGPTTEMIAAMETIWPQVTPYSVLDLFGGTGALSNVSHRLGAKKILSVDAAPPQPSTIQTADAFSFPITEFFDLILVDHFIEQFSQVVRDLFPRLANRTRYILWNAGYALYESIVNNALVDLEHIFSPSARLVVNDCLIVLLKSANDYE